MTSITPPPVFIVSSERSGSNLLRKRISEHQSVYFGPQPVHFFKHLYHITYQYNNLRDAENLRALIARAIKMCKGQFGSPSPWTLDIDEEEVLTHLYNHYPQREYAVFHVADALMRIYANSQGYKSYVCKDNHIFKYLFQIIHHIPEAKFIYLYRDPRDYLSSQLKRPTQVKSSYYLSRMWRHEQLEAFQLFYYPSLFDFIAISYEDLIQDEAYQLQRVCNFLEVEKLLKPKQMIENTDLHEWRNLNKMTISSNSGKYKKYLSVGQVKMVERVCKKEMNHLGYSLEYPKDESSPSLLLKGFSLTSGYIQKFFSSILK